MLWYDIFLMGDNNDEIKEFQEMLLKKGFKLPKWGADGFLGHETWNATILFCNAENIEWDEKYTYVNIPLNVINAVRMPIGADSPDEVLDIRYDHPILKGSKSPRNLELVTGIMLHQTACFLGERPERWHDIACHIGVTQKGQILYVNDFSAYLYHGHNYNRTTIGIEIDGNFRGIEEKPNTLWVEGGGSVEGHRHAGLTAQQCMATRQAIRFICNEMEKRGAKISTIVAHRQGSDQRQGDPGSWIWKECGIWAQKNLNLYNNPMATKGDGYRIPYDWDKRGLVNWHNKWDTRGLNEIGTAMFTIVDGATREHPREYPDFNGYDKEFEKLVKEFQKHAGDLYVDGDLGPKTYVRVEQLYGSMWV
ncbi:MAG: N-acetylmuramoyl-L-alanine amidase [Candidatus Peribacteraceae bacterium]|nr:N-acetylmuramoyl-L-alanine amidase [Candidatus Peribacteraceae bacterium]